MKFKNIPFLLGFKPKVREYGHKIISIHLSGENELKLAQWLHPDAGKINIEEDEIVALKKFLNPGDVAIDIGGYTGDTAIPLALVTGKSGQVLVLEPNKYVFKILEINADLIRDKGNILPLPFAATPENKSMEFEYSDPGFCNGGFHEGISKWKHGHAYKLKVEGRNLVNYLKEHHHELIPRIRYIKIDAEGFDYSVLESISEIIEKQKPFIRVEVYKHTDLVYRLKLFRFLKTRNYNIFLFNDSSDYKGQLITENDLMKWVHYDIFAVPANSA